jgi:ketosteroid isomerase-like protein
VLDIALPSSPLQEFPVLEVVMTRSARVVLAIAALAALAACAKPPAADVAAEEQAVRDASAAWMKAVQAHDWAAAAASFAPDGMSFPEHKEPVVGPAAAQAAAEAEWAGMPNASLSWTTDKVVVAASGDLAYEIGTWTMMNEGKQDKGKYVTVWQKVGGAWKAAADIGVSTMPVADSMTM